MSGIYIGGMEMPKSCTECGCEQEGFWCGVLEDYPDTKYFDNKRHPNCPLVPVPPHGRLIDEDAFAAEMRQRQTAAEDWLRDALEADNEEAAIRADAILSFLCEVKLTMEKMPTIIPADKGAGE